MWTVLTPSLVWHWQSWHFLICSVYCARVFCSYSQINRENYSFLLSLQIHQEKAPSDLYNWQWQSLLQGRLRKTHILSNITQKCLFIYLMAEACISLLLCDLIQRRDSCCIFNWYIKIAGCTRHCLTSMESLKSSDRSAEHLCRSHWSSRCRYLSRKLFFFFFDRQPSSAVVR